MCIAALDALQLGVIASGVNASPELTVMIVASGWARLEQQRGPQPSEQMLGSLARALRLTSSERDYLFRVAGHNAPGPAAVASHVAPALLRVLDRLDDTPR
jgi:hypothetical protein